MSRTRFLLEWSAITLVACALACPLAFTFLHEVLGHLLENWPLPVALTAKAGLYMVLIGAFLGLGQGTYLRRRLDRKIGSYWFFTTVVGLGVGGGAGIYLGRVGGDTLIEQVGGLELTWLYDLVTLMPWMVFAGLLVSILQRWAIRSRVSKGWLIWIGASLASWCVAALAIVLVEETMGPLNWSRHSPRAPRALFGILVGILMGVPVGVGTGLALNRILGGPEEEETPAGG